MAETDLKGEPCIDLFSLPEAQPILRMIEAGRQGKNIVENCCFCHQPIEMRVFAGITFNWHCPCGKSDGFFRGL